MPAARSSRWKPACIGFAGILAAAPTARAEIAPVPASIPGPYRAQYLEMLRHPADLARIAEMAQRFEDAGLSAHALRLYERMLLISDDLHGIRLRVARQRLLGGNPAAALAHLDRLPPDQLTGAEAHAYRALRREASKAAGRHRIDGRVTAGLRYDSNANAAPDLNPDFGDAARLGTEEEPDFSIYGDVALRHGFDPKRQDALTYENSLRLVVIEQFELDEFDRAFARVTTGPRVPIEPGLPTRVSLRPYLVGELYAFGGELYSAALGGGIEGRDRPRAKLEVFARAEAQYTVFGSAADVDENTSGTRIDFPFRDADDLDGALVRGEVGATWFPLERVRLQAMPFVGYRGSGEDAFARVEYGVRAAVTFAFDAVEAVSERPPTATVAGRYARFNYQGAEAPTLPDREEDLIEVGGAVEVPLGARFSVTVGVGWQRLSSNVDFFEYDNIRADASIGYRF